MLRNFLVSRGFLGKTFWILSVLRTFLPFLDPKVLFQRLVELGVPNKQSTKSFLRKWFTAISGKFSFLGFSDESRCNFVVIHLFSSLWIKSTSTREFTAWRTNLILFVVHDSTFFDFFCRTQQKLVESLIWLSNFADFFTSTGEKS